MEIHHHCTCSLVPSFGATDVSKDEVTYIDLACIGLSWLEVPIQHLNAALTTRSMAGDGSTPTNFSSLPTKLTMQILNKSSTPSSPLLAIRRLALVDGHLHHVGQDAFKKVPTALEALDLSRNSISSINVNAFRGVEGTLSDLHLASNNLVAIPAPSLTYLSQLERLHLEGNRIAEVPPSSSTQHQLVQLKFLHLDGNCIEHLHEGAMSSFSAVQVLTLSNNRIHQLDAGSLPPSLWFLDLRANRLRRVPYAAVGRLAITTLNTLDLSGNLICELAIRNRPSPSSSSTRARAKRGRKIRSNGVQLNELNLLLAYNRLSQLNKGAFAEFPRLNRLDLSYNQIRSIHTLAFNGISSLRKLDLAHNLIIHLPSTCLSHLHHSLLWLNLDSNMLGNIPAALNDLVALAYLNLGNNFIKAADIRLLPANLSELNLANNQLERIPFESLQPMHRLAVLDLSKNRISKAGGIAFGSTLVRLNLAANNITELTSPDAFSQMKRLQHLDLSHNDISRITRVAFDLLSALETLHLEGNALRELPRDAFHGLPRLKHLRLDGNEIKELPPNNALQTLASLEYLSLSNNHIYTLSAKTFHYHSVTGSIAKLQSLNLAYNRIGSIPKGAFDSLTKLENLQLDANNVTTLVEGAISVESLRTITMSNNRIAEIHPRAFVSVPQLEHISLANNQIRHMEKSSLCRASQLARLDLSHNLLDAFSAEVFEMSGSENPPQLRHLDLSYNAIRKVELVAVKGSLVELKLQHNLLEFIGDSTLQDFALLEDIDLSHNQIIDLASTSFQGSRHLRRVSLASNNLKRISRGTFAQQTFISSLELSNNQLSSAPGFGVEEGAFGLGNVAHLDLSSNLLTNVPIEALASVAESLTTLNLAHNSILSIGRETFRGLHNLSRLVLAHNRIESIGEAAFAELGRLCHLDLSDNPVSSWSPAAFAGISPILTRLELAQLGLFSVPSIVASELKWLNLSYNSIFELRPEDVGMVVAKENTITAISTMQSESARLPKASMLEVLDLSGNTNLADIKPAVLRLLSNLRQLNLSGTGLRHLGSEHLKALAQLESLHLANMPALVRLPDAAAFAHMHSLEHFEIRVGPPSQCSRGVKFSKSRAPTNYNISSFLGQLPPLRTLAFDTVDEALTPDVFARGVDLRMLRQLTVTGCELYKWHPRALERLSGYRVEVRIEGTSLKQPRLLADLLKNMSQVRRLHLSLANNRIETLANPFTTTATTKSILDRDTNRGVMRDALKWQRIRLEILELRGNPIICDCRMEWLSAWITHLASSSDPDDQVWARAKSALVEARCRNRIPCDKVMSSSQNATKVSAIGNESERGHNTSMWDVYGLERSCVHHTNMLCDSEGRLIPTATSWKSAGVSGSRIILGLWLLRVTYIGLVHCTLIRPLLILFT